MDDSDVSPYSSDSEPFVLSPPRSPSSSPYTLRLQLPIVRDRRSRALSIGHKDNPRGRVQSDDEKATNKSVDLEEATMMRTSDGTLRGTSPVLIRSLSDGKLGDVLDGFLRLDRELRDAKAEADKEAKWMLEAIKNCPGAIPEVSERVEAIGAKLWGLGLVEMKAGGLSPLITEIQQIQLDADSDWNGRVFLTKLLLSLANVTQAIHQFELISINMATPMTPSRRASPSPSPTHTRGDQSPTTKGFDASFILPSTISQVGLEPTDEQKNVFIETDPSGIILCLSPSSLEVLNVKLDDVVNTDLRDFLATEKDVEALDSAFRLLMANPSDITEIKCCLLFGGEARVVDGKGIFVTDHSAEPTRVVWVFRISSDVVEDEEGEAPEILLCQICNLRIPKEFFERHATECGDLLQSQNATTVANEKLKETRQMVLGYPSQHSTHYVITRFLKRIDRALALTVDAVPIDQANAGKLKNPILVWSKSFPKKALKDHPDLQKLGTLVEQAINEKVLRILNLKKVESNIRTTAELLASGSSGNITLIQSISNDAMALSTESKGSPSSPSSPNSPGSLSPIAGRAKKLRTRPSNIVSPAPTSIEDFEIVKPISKGAFGKVFLAKKKNASFYYAIKVLKKEEMIRKNQVDNIKQERKIMSRTNSPFLVKLYYSFQSTNNLYLVQEYCNGGDCAAMLKLVGYLDEKWAVSYVAEVVLALEYLHGEGIVHRDLKPDNLLIDSYGHIKLTDFGLSRVGFLKRNNAKKKLLHQRLQGSPDILSKLGDRDSVAFAGTPDYLAPEVVLGVTDLGPEVDWWALGVIFYQFMYGFPPFNADTPYQIFENILNRAINWANEENPPSTQAFDLMNSLMNMNPETRLGSKGVQEIKSHPLFQGLDWSRLRELKPSFIPKTASADDTTYFDSRGLTLKDLEDELLESNKSSAVPNVESPQVSTPPPRMTHRRARSGSPKSIEFNDFTFMDAGHLREQNELEAGKTRPRISSSNSSGSSSSPLLIALGTSAFPTPRSRHNSLPSGTSPAELAAKSPSLENKHVLVADGDPITSKILETIMGRLGLRCSVADNAATAVMLATSGNEKFDVMIFDKDLPDGGADRAAALIKAVKSPNKTTPIICTTYEKYLGASRSFDDFLFKPFSKADVDEKLRTWAAT